MEAGKSGELFERMTQKQAGELLTPHEVIRDPLHQDISISALERAVIDTAAFQRLRWLNQLGPTQVVYPGAVHTRFIHSVGTLHTADQLVQIANRNWRTYNQPYLLHIDHYPHLLVRMFALLHDVAHMPFGHTLEDEGNLASPEWEDNARADHWLGPKGEIPSVITRFLVQFGVSPKAAEAFVQDVRKYVLFKGDPSELEFPFVVDLVGNTLCADLLDYLYRDMYFCGLSERAGDRVIKYLAVVRIKETNPTGGKRSQTLLPTDSAEKGKGRVVLLTYRFEREHPAGGNLKHVAKPEIISEAIDLLRRRYALAEKVYFHRTKLAASAMLISAVASSSFSIRDAYEMSDGDFLSRLLSDSDPRTNNFITAYMSRRLYKPVYRIAYREERDGDAESKKLWRKYDEFRNPKWRVETEQKLEKYAGLKAGTVSIYCPDRAMNLKEFEMLVQSQPGGDIKQLAHILDHSWKMEMDAINQRFAPLWSTFVFVDPNVLDPTMIQSESVMDFSGLCEELFGFPNAELELQTKGRPLMEQVAARVIRDYEGSTDEKVPYDIYAELVQSDHRGQGPDLVAEMHNHLVSLMKSKEPSSDKPDAA